MILMHCDIVSAKIILPLGLRFEPKVWSWRKRPLVPRKELKNDGIKVSNFIVYQRTLSIELFGAS